MDILYTLAALFCVIALAVYLALQGFNFPRMTNVTLRKNKRPKRAKKQSDEFTSIGIQHLIVNVLKFMEETRVNLDVTDIRSRKLVTILLYLDRMMMQTVEAFGFGGDARVVFYRGSEEVDEFCLRVYHNFLYPHGEDVVRSSQQKVEYVLKLIDKDGLFSVFHDGCMRMFAELDCMDQIEFEVATNVIEDKAIDRYITYMKDNPFNASDEREWIGQLYQKE